MRRALCGAVVALSFVAGCSGVPVPVAASPASTSAAAAVSSLPSPQPRPVKVEVAGRDISGEVLLEGLGLDEDGGHAEPPVTEPQLASWYNLGPVPGELGPAVVLGHVDGGGKAGVFFRLSSVENGDVVFLTREDGSVISFEVYRTQQISKSDFPTLEVYGPTEGSELRLITCGGSFDASVGHYRDNVIVYARLV